MTAKKNEVTVKVADKVANGQGGFFRVGTKFEPCDADAAKELKSRGLVD